MKNGIRVGMFGEFNIEAGSVHLNEKDIRSSQMIKLLAFLLIERKRTVSVPELCDVLWGDEEIENPTGALKNLVYRLRKLLSEFGEDIYIINRKGIYCWNPDVEVELDFEIFETKCTEAANEMLSVPERITCYEEAIALYKGMLLPKYSSEFWVIPLSAWYHTCYLTAVKELEVLYEQEKQFEKMELVAKQALQYDSLDEILHCWVIKSLIGQGKNALAMSCYQDIKKLLYDNLGLRHSEHLDEIYHKINELQGMKISTMEDICEDIIEKKEKKGVFICDYHVFKEIYRLEARRIARMGTAEYILLLTLRIKERRNGRKRKKEDLIEINLENLKEILQESLRIGDVVTQCSDCQYIILLQACSFEAGKMVAKRIVDRFEERYSKKNVIIEYDLKELAPNENFSV